MNNKNKKDIQETKNLLYAIGALLLVVSPIVWMLVPSLLSDALCNPGPTGAGCGYANIGINAYAFFISLVPFVLGIVAILVAFFKRSR